MSAPLGPLAHIQEGYTYHNGQERRLYPADPSTVLSSASNQQEAEAAFFAQCRDLSIGPLAVHACIDIPNLTFAVEIRLLGALIGRCELSPRDQECTIGGSIDGFKAEVSLNLDVSPFKLTIKAQVCVPFLGCRTFGPFEISP